MARETVEIAASPHTRVLFDDRGGNELVVVFSDDAGGAAANRIWGAPIFEAMGISAIGVVARAQHWYFAADMLPLLDLAGPVIGRFGVVAAFGWSMGGYGALKYGARVGAQATIAFSPQFSIAPDVVGTFDPASASRYDAGRHRDMAVAARDLAAPAFVVYDPVDRTDRHHAARLAALGPKIALVRNPAGRPVGPMPAIEAGLMPDVLRTAWSADDTREGARRMRRTLRRARRRSASYWRALAEALRRHRRPAAAAQCYRQAIAIAPTPTVRVGLVSALLESGERLGLARLLAAAEAADPKAPHLWHEIAFAYLHLGRPGAAVRASEVALRLNPNDPQIRITLGQSLLKAERPRIAAAALQAAEARAGADASAWRRLAAAYRQAGDAAGQKRAEAHLAGLVRNPPKPA